MTPDLDIAFTDSSQWEEGPMRERMRWLREHDPVHWSAKDDLFVVTRFEDVSYVSKHQELFTSEHGVRPGTPTKIGLIDEGEPRHGQLRGLINKGFTPRMVGKLEEIFRKITTEAIDGVAKQGECEFVEDIAVPLPLRLIAAMIGIREEDYDRFHAWSDTMIATEGNLSDPEQLAKGAQAFIEYANYVTPIIEERRNNPKDDLVSILVGAKDDGLLAEYDETESFRGALVDDPELRNDELIKLLVILMVAGNETTRNGLSGAMQLLIENPDARDRLIADPSLIPQAVEEMLRLTSPVQSFSRTVVEDTELRDVKLEAGQKVLMVYYPANTDPEQFEDPLRFDIDRKPGHLAFGIGSHFCMGANLARMELRVALEELLRRLPDMEYSDGGPVIHPSSLVRTCAEMKLRFTPEA